MTSRNERAVGRPGERPGGVCGRRDGARSRVRSLRRATAAGLGLMAVVTVGQEQARSAHVHVGGEEVVHHHHLFGGPHRHDHHHGENGRHHPRRPEDDRGREPERTIPLAVALASPEPAAELDCGFRPLAPCPVRRELAAPHRPVWSPTSPRAPPA